MVRICIEEITNCELSHFHQDFDGGYWDNAVATVRKRVYCDNINDISFQDIQLLKSYNTVETHEFECSYSDLSSEYENGSRVLSANEVQALLIKLNSLRRHYLYCEDKKSCPFYIGNIRLEEENLYNNIKIQIKNKIEEEERILKKAQTQYEQNLNRIKSEENELYYKFFRNELLKGKLWDNKPFPYSTLFPIELAIEKQDCEMFRHIVSSNKCLFSQETSSETDRCKKIVISPKNILSILSYAQMHADYYGFNLLRKELMNLVNFYISNAEIKGKHLFVILKANVNYAKKLDDIVLYKKALLDLLNIFISEVKLLPWMIQELLCVLDEILPISKDLYMDFYQELRKTIANYEQYDIISIQLLLKRIIASIYFQDTILLNDSLSESIIVNKEYKEKGLLWINNVVPTAVYLALSRIYIDLEIKTFVIDSFAKNEILQSKLYKCLKETKISEDAINVYNETIEQCILNWGFYDAKILGRNSPETQQYLKLQIQRRSN